MLENSQKGKESNTFPVMIVIKFTNYFFLFIYFCNKTFAIFLSLETNQKAGIIVFITLYLKKFTSKVQEIQKSPPFLSAFCRRRQKYQPKTTSPLVFI